MRLLEASMRSTSLECQHGSLLLIGGGAKSRAYREVLATLSNRSVVADETEIVAAGACVQAAIMESTSDVMPL